MKELGNYNEDILFSKEFQEDILYENVIQRIQIKTKLHIKLDEEIIFLSKNFHDFNVKYPESIFDLNVDIIEQIISNDHLKIYNEEELFNIILKLYNKSKKYATLFSYVIFINLPTKSIQEFNEHFDINDINLTIWKSISYRLEQEISKESQRTSKTSYQELLKNRYINKKYEHILKQLSEEFNGNVHTLNIVHITASSIKFYSVEDIVEENSNYFSTNDEADSWIQFDFKERKVLLESYTLKTHQGSWNLKNWILEVSNDGEHYTEIDRKENCNLINGLLKQATFKDLFVSNKLVQTGVVAIIWP